MKRTILAAYTAFLVFTLLAAPAIAQSSGGGIIQEWTVQAFRDYGEITPFDADLPQPRPVYPHAAAARPVALLWCNKLADELGVPRVTPAFTLRAPISEDYIPVTICRLGKGNYVRVLGVRK